MWDLLATVDDSATKNVKLDSLQSIRLPNGKHAAWVNATRAFPLNVVSDKNSGFPMNGSPDNNYAAEYQSVFLQVAHEWKPIWEQTNVLHKNRPLGEWHYSLLAVCDMNRDGIAEVVLEGTNWEMWIFQVFELRGDELVEVASF